MLDSPAVNAFALPGGFIYIRMAMRDDTDPAMNLDFWLSSGAAPVWTPARRPTGSGRSTCRTSA